MPHSDGRLRTTCLITALTLFCLGVHGYHPYSEDGGVYLAGIEKLLEPALFPHFTAFVTEHLRFSFFAPCVAALVHLSGLSLPWTLLLLYLGCIWLTLAAAWMVASRITESATARLGAITLLACWLPIPIAGTSLMLFDPYLTARSFSTPLALLSLAFALDLAASRLRSPRAAAACVLSLGAAALLHPLMAAYTLLAVVVVWLLAAREARTRRLGQIALTSLAVGTAALVQVFAPAESRDYVLVALTRYYWFPLRWQWFEQVGLLAPLIMLALLGRADRKSDSVHVYRLLAQSGIALGAVTGLIAFLFARAGLTSHLVARLQPLRSFQIVYLIMTLSLGVWLGEQVLERKPLRWLLLLLGMGGLMAFVERQTYTHSARLELPFGPEARSPENAWERAFFWVADHTNTQAVFALDSHYITSSGEDAQCFRATAQRSALPDYSKDGGEAAITPELTGAWTLGQRAQTDLNRQSDAERLRRLQPYGVDFIVLSRSAVTSLACPYVNEAVKVCRMP